MKKQILGIVGLFMASMQLASTTVKNISSEHDFSKIGTAKQFVMVHFYEKKHEQRKAFARIAEKFPEVCFLEVKADHPEMKKLAESNGVMKFPACILMRDGKHINEILYLDHLSIDTEQNAARLMTEFLFKYFRVELESQRRAREAAARAEEESRGMGGVSVVPITYSNDYVDPGFYYDYYPNPTYVTYGVIGDYGSHFRGGSRYFRHRNDGGGHWQGSRGSGGSHSLSVPQGGSGLSDRDNRIKSQSH